MIDNAVGLLHIGRNRKTVQIKWLNSVR